MPPSDGWRPKSRRRGTGRNRGGLHCSKWHCGRKRKKSDKRLPEVSRSVIKRTNFWQLMISKVRAPALRRPSGICMKLGSVISHSQSKKRERGCGFAIRKNILVWDLSRKSTLSQLISRANCASVFVYVLFCLNFPFSCKVIRSKTRLRISKGWNLTLRNRRRWRRRQHGRGSKRRSGLKRDRGWNERLS